MPFFLESLRVVDVTSSTHSAANLTLVNCDTTSNSITVNLPAGFQGARIGVRLDTLSGTRTVTIDGNLTETINGSTTLTLYLANDYVELEWDGSEWAIIVDAIQPHYASMTLESSKQLNDSQQTIIPFDTINSDAAGLATTGAGANFTIRRAGKYQITLKATMDAGMADNDYIYLDIALGGTTFARNSVATNASLQVPYPMMSACPVLAASNVIAGYIFMERTGGNTTMGNVNDIRNPRMQIQEQR